MKSLVKLLAVGAVLGLAACQNAGMGGVGTGPAIGTVPGATASNPASPAYFAERVGDRILFTVDHATLDDAARATLDQQAAWFNDNPDYSAVIEGHADEQGTREYNLALGARRASSVQEYLVSRGVSPARLRTVTYGKERPLEICSDEACYRQNRRAVTVLRPGAGV
jgi:peptidoglycan-associated lipoprotein